MDEQTTATMVLIFIWVFVNTVFTCAVVKYEVDKAERWLNNSIKCTNLDIATKFRDISYDFKSIKKSVEELRDSLAEDDTETLVSVDEVIKALENMKNKGV